MKNHEIEDCAPDCFDEKEALVVPAKPKFTDEDLKQWKLEMEATLDLSEFDKDRALLSRLEAAEAYGESRVPKPFEKRDPLEAPRLLKAWREVSGK